MHTTPPVSYDNHTDGEIDQSNVPSVMRGAERLLTAWQIPVQMTDSKYSEQGQKFDNLNEFTMMWNSEGCKSEAYGYALPLEIEISPLW